MSDDPFTRFAQEGDDPPQWREYDIFVQINDAEPLLISREMPIYSYVVTRNEIDINLVAEDEVPIAIRIYQYIQFSDNRGVFYQVPFIDQIHCSKIPTGDLLIMIVTPKDG